MPDMTKPTEYERGPMHGEHTTRFYWILAVVLVVLGVAGGILLRPDDWSYTRSIISGSMVGLLSGYCVFAWHWLLGPIREE